jgi:hypothetical protein
MEGNRLCAVADGLPVKPASTRYFCCICAHPRGAIFLENWPEISWPEKEKVQLGCRVLTNKGQ